MGYYRISSHKLDLKGWLTIFDHFQTQIKMFGRKSSAGVDFEAVLLTEFSSLFYVQTESIDVTKPPVVKPKGSKGIQVFDIQKSHDVTSVPLPTASETSSKPNRNGVVRIL